MDTSLGSYHNIIAKLNDCIKTGDYPMEYIHSVAGHLAVTSHPNLQVRVKALTLLKELQERCIDRQNKQIREGDAEIERQKKKKLANQDQRAGKREVGRDKEKEKSDEKASRPSIAVAVAVVVVQYMANIQASREAEDELLLVNLSSFIDIRLAVRC
jgi:hypothetical protein